MGKRKKAISLAMSFIVLFGVISLFSDIVHEGSASIWGSYLTLLGASAATIGFVSGLGELIGYSLRFLFGKLADKTKKYWTFTILGYCLDTLAVPLLALVGENGWIWACILLAVQKVGKAIKKPSKDTIMSFAASKEGAGKGFAIQEVLDQTGAFLGPVLLYVVMLFKTEGSAFEAYSLCFLVLAIPALITLVLLLIARLRFPHPDKFEEDTIDEPFRMKGEFLFYIIGISFFAFGFVDYSLILVHVTQTYADIGNGLRETSSLITTGTIPLLYAGAMLFDAVSALFFGLLYDKKGIKAVILSAILALPFPLFIFAFDSLPCLFVGIALWGIGMGAQESILKAAVSKMVSKGNRATGYGIFEFSFGVFWFLGSWLLGALYDISILSMVIVSICAQLFAIPFYILSEKRRLRDNA